MNTLRDFILYAHLKLRLLKSTVERALSSVIFSDVVTEKGMGDRLYQVYGLAIGVVWLALMWFFVLDFTSDIFSTMGAVLTQVVIQYSLIAPVGIFVLLAFQNARSSPWKMSPPDISFIAASPLKIASIILWEMLKELLLWGVVGGLVGFLLGVGFQAGTGVGINPLIFSFFGMISLFCAALWSWVVGMARLTIPRNKNRVFIFTSCCALLLILTLLVLLMMAEIVTIDLLLSPLCLALLTGLIITGFIFLLELANRVDTIKAIEENALYSDMYNLRNLPMYDAAGYSEIRRKKRLAKRMPIASLAIGEGTNALVARSIMSHIRQFEGIPSLLLWGTFAAPMTTFLLLVPQTPFLWMIWAQMFLLMSKGAKELTRVFRDDMRHTAICDHLPFSTMKLFLFDSSIGFALCTAISLAVTIVAVGSGGNLLLGIIICLAVNVVIAFCSGIDGLSFFQTGRKMSYEMALIIFLAGVFLTSLTGLPLLSLGFLLVYAAALIGVMRFS